jgi:hypothetical protein
MYGTRRTKHNNVVLQRKNGLEAARITLPTAPAKELAVDSTGLVALRRDHVQATTRGHLRSDAYIGAATGHIRGDRNLPGLSGPRDNFRLVLILARIQHLVGQTRLT